MLKRVQLSENKKRKLKLILETWFGFNSVKHIETQINAYRVDLTRMVVTNQRSPSLNEQKGLSAITIKFIQYNYCLH